MSRNNNPWAEKNAIHESNSVFTPCAETIIHEPKLENSNPFLLYRMSVIVYQ